jgi:hypothetical protein
MTEEAAKQMLDAMASRLGEHFEAVQIMPALRAAE